MEERAVSRGRGWLGACVALLVLAAACGKEKPATQAITGDLKQTVAEVEGEIIMLADVNNAVGMLRTGQVPNVDPNGTDLELQKRAVDDLISQRLLYLEAKKTGMVPTDEEAQDALHQFSTQRFPSDSVFVAELAKLNLTKDDFLREWKRNEAVNRFVARTIQDTVHVTEEQARAYYDAHPEEFTRPEMVRARHILVRAEETAPPEEAAKAEAKIRDLYERARGGADFAALAREHSEDVGSGQQGGDLGFFRRGQMVPPFDSIAFALEPGQISEPLRTRFGWHIIRLEEKTPPQQMEFSAIPLPRLQAGLTQRRAYDAVQGLIADLKSKAKIKRKV